MNNSDQILSLLPQHIRPILQELEKNIQNLESRCDSAVNYNTSYPCSYPYKDIVHLIKHNLFLGGKRMRPILFFLFCDLFKLDLNENQDLLAYARSIEYVHLATLCHDDVIDNATTRRGKPSLNVVSSNKKAILSGDYLLAEVIANLAAQKNLEIIHALSEVIRELTVGEWMQLNVEVNLKEANKVPSPEQILEIIEKKTASLITYCCTTPALLAKVPAKILDVAKDFGKNLGTAFQLIDDILDFSTTNIHTLTTVQNETTNFVLVQLLSLDSSYLPLLHSQSEQFQTNYAQHKFKQTLDKAISNTEELALEKTMLANKSLDELFNKLCEEPDVKINEKSRSYNQLAYHSLKTFTQHLLSRKT
ncbi:MAG: polyprenyl synthetase family protein [Oligoflexia bacterium]|nr:polyprenyl synthetase family protein [Oligoflexia bacterium]